MKWWWMKLRWWIIGLTVFSGLVLFTPWPADLLMQPLIVDQQPVRSDVIIVLGAGSRKEGDLHLPPQAHARVGGGLQLIEQGYAPQMILTGGHNKKTGWTESEWMERSALRQGASIDQIIQENQAKNTWENALYSLRIMSDQDWGTALVVTSPYHTWRACKIFKKFEANVRCVAAPMRTAASNTPGERLMDFRSVVREYGAIVYFYLKHYI